jgi:predicted  nucleic acid-binding Zn-ribbon protein
MGGVGVVLQNYVRIRPPPTFVKFDYRLDIYKNFTFHRTQMDTPQQIYSKLQSADSKQLWAFAQEMNSVTKKLASTEKKLQKAQSRDVDLENKEELRRSVMEHLFAESAKGNAQASDKLTKIAGLGEATQDIIIEVVNYAPPKKVRKKSKPTK